jgi:MFS transporter, PHS family, inorganic phosphate transporter
MGFAYNHISSNGLLAIYVLAQFFFNFGMSLLLSLKNVN